jgi:signal transduction histidine kinase
VAPAGSFGRGHCDGGHDGSQRSPREGTCAALAEAPNADEASEIRALRARIATLEARNAELRRYAQAVAHDLAQPLRGIAQVCALIREEHGRALPAEALRLLDLATRSASRLQGMLRDLLAEARGCEAGPGTAAPVAAAGDRVLAEVLEAVAPAAEVAGCRTRAGPLPAVAVGRAELFRLLANLVGNAIRHRGEVSPEVEVGAAPEPDGRRWRFWVADNGPGVPPAERERIFGDGTRGPGSAGAGIGLALCREIVARHGGRVWVEPSPCRGSRFLFTLPAADPAGAHGGGAADGA